MNANAMGTIQPNKNLLPNRVLSMDCVCIAISKQQNKMVEARGFEPLSLSESSKASTDLAGWKCSATLKAARHLTHA